VLRMGDGTGGDWTWELLDVSAIVSAPDKDRPLRPTAANGGWALNGNAARTGPPLHPAVEFGPTQGTEIAQYVVGRAATVPTWTEHKQGR